MPPLPRKTTWQPAWKPSKKRRDFAASPIDTATPQENQRLETRHVGGAKWAFRARLPPILTLSTVIKQVGMSQSAMPAMQNDMTTCLETLEKERFAASPIDTATPQENQRLETRDVGASKRAFRARLPPIFTLSFKIDVFLRVFIGASKFATSKSMFRARLPSIFSTSHKMPRLPRNLHLVATWRSPANAIRKKHATRRV